MKKKKSKIIIAVSSIFVLFSIFNLLWYLSYKNYSNYSENLEEFVPRKSYVLKKEGYLFNVKYPDYLSFTGNLAVATNDEKIALIIWPSYFGKTKYGIQIEDEDKMIHSIMIEKNRKAVNSKDRKMIESNMVDIKSLFQKSEVMWGDI